MSSSFIETIHAGWALAGRSIKEQIRKHFLGYAWNLIIPILYAVCFVLVKNGLLGKDHSADPQDQWHVLRAFAGMTLFQLWFQILQEMSEIVNRNKGILRGLSIGIIPFVLAILFEGGILLAVRLATIFGAILMLRLSVSWSYLTGLWFVLIVAQILLSAAAIGLLLAPWATLYGDVRKALRAFNLPLVLITPIFYPVVTNTSTPLYWVNLVNPLASPLSAIVDALQGSSPILGGALIVWCCAAFALFVWAAMQMRKHVPTLLERLGSS